MLGEIFHIGPSKHTLVCCDFMELLHLHHKKPSQLIGWSNLSKRRSHIRHRLSNQSHAKKQGSLSNQMKWNARNKDPSSHLGKHLETRASAFRKEEDNKRKANMPICPWIVCQSERAECFVCVKGLWALATNAVCGRTTHPMGNTEQNRNWRTKQKLKNK